MAFAYFDTPMAATMTTLVLLVLGIVAAIQFVVLERRVHYR
jgi:sn-glycerol 3-phosphate transport system permease protein